MGKGGGKISAQNGDGGTGHTAGGALTARQEEEGARNPQTAPREGGQVHAEKRDACGGQENDPKDAGFR
jgi:hypothetical protein